MTAVSLHVRDEGSGPLIVLLHGFPENGSSWRHQIPELVRAGFRVVAPDLRGYGESPKPRGVDAYRLTEIVDDLHALVQKLGDEPFVLVGHDWGGFAAWYYVMAHPERLRKLIVLNVPHPAPLSRELHRSFTQKRKLAYQLLFRLPLLPELLMRMFGGALLRSLGSFTPEEVRAYRQAWRGSYSPMFHYYRAVPRARHDMRRLVRPIDVPTLLIWGEREPVFLRSTMENADSWVPNLHIEVIGDAGHFVQTDAAERVTELLLEFCRS
jgi:pimeloyl-ACP methyl ester carboxylesterase